MFILSLKMRILQLTPWWSQPLDEMPLKMTSGILFIHVKARENIEWDELICLKKDP